jgi:hypothetical protein
LPPVQTVLKWKDSQPNTLGQVVFPIRRPGTLRRINYDIQTK